MTACKDPKRCGWHHSEETKQKIGDKSKGRSPNQQTRIKLSLSHKGKSLSEETKAKISKSRIGIIFSGDHRKHLSESHQGKSGYWTGKRRDLDTCKKIGEFHRNRKTSAATKLLQQRAMSGKHNGKNNPMYIDGRSKLRNPYCERFNNEFKERVRAYFNYVCFECGTPQNGKRLAIHHVNFRKDSCCNPDAPRLFVPLCHSCHSKTNVNREYWETYFTEMIDGYYQGKCYFTKEEMLALK